MEKRAIHALCGTPAYNCGTVYQLTLTHRYHCPLTDGNEGRHHQALTSDLADGRIVYIRFLSTAHIFIAN